MVHQLAEATDGSGAAERVVLLDYGKAFDLIDHNLLVRKVFNLSIPHSVACWVADFLMRRQQRVKLSAECYLGIGPSHSWGAPGHQIGPLGPILMINEYVDDTTVAEIVSRGLPQSDIQSAVDIIEGWSQMQSMHLNATKCKELIIDSKWNKHTFSFVVVAGMNSQL